MTKILFAAIFILCGALLIFIHMRKSNKFTKQKTILSEISPEVSDVISAIEEIYNLAYKHPSLSPKAILLSKRRISSTYLACNIKLVTGLAKNDISLAENFSDKGLFYWQAELESKATVVLKPYGKHKIDDFEQFETTVWSELLNKHPDWYFSSDRNCILF